LKYLPEPGGLMALESAAYVNQLVPSNPAAGDPAAQGQAHLGLLKTALVNTFPNLNAPVTGTPWQFNAATGSFSVTLNDTEIRARPQPLVSTTRGGGVLYMAASAAVTQFEVFNDTNSWIVNASPAAGGAATGSATMSATGTWTTSGDVVAGGKVRESGNALIPAGVIVMWTGAIAPAGWTLCNGTAGAPDLRDRFVVGSGGSYSLAGVGGATTASGVSDSQGSHAHTGFTGAAGSHNHSGATNAYTLLIGDIPSHSHGVTDPGHNHLALPNVAWGVVYNWPAHGGGSSFTAGGDVQIAVANTVGTGASITNISVNAAGGGGPHSHVIATDGNHNHSISSDGTHSHTTVVATLPPYYALAFIMKL
jgi:hypothetical protein